MTETKDELEHIFNDPKWHGIPKNIVLLARQLGKIHGPVDVRRESSGIHLYMASPKGLEEDGVVELSKKHLAVNAEKYLGLGKYGLKGGVFNMLNQPKQKKGCAMCMKYRVPYSVKELLKMQPVQERVPEDTDISKFVSTAVNKEAWMVTDEKTGRRIPAPAGRCVPLTSLPSTHPAVEYLVARRFDLEDLERRFNASFCEEEYPEDVVLGRKYRRMPLGFKDTPQGRIIFDANIEGVRLGWQARILERDDGELKQFWHPYARMWTTVQYMHPETKKWTNLDEVEKDYFDWNPSKYKTATGAKRKELLMGVDAAVEWNRLREDKVAVLAEGPLDAARARGPGIAMLGSHMSESQAVILRSRFDRVVYVADSGDAGAEALISARAACMGVGLRFQSIALEDDDGKVDLGGMSYDEADQLLKPYLL